MVHRKPCGCVNEIKYESSIKVLKTVIKKVRICEKHKEVKPKLKNCFNKGKKK